MNTLFTVMYLMAIVVAFVITIFSIRNRFLPMGVPLGALAIVMMIASSMQLYWHLMQTFSVVSHYYWIDAVSISLAQFVLPFWVHCIAEYKYNRKIALSRYSWFLIEPVVTYAVIAINIPNVDWTSKLGAGDFMGEYYLFHFAYMQLVWCSVLVWSVYTVSKKSDNNIYAVVQIFVSLATPLILFGLFRDGYLEKPVGGAALILLLLWAAKQSSLLDIVPSALSGVLSRVNAGVLVFNAQMDLVYKNTYASKFVKPPSTLTKDDVKMDLSWLPEGLKSSFNFGSGESQSAVIKLAQELTEQALQGLPEYTVCYIDATLSPISNPKTHQVVGQILLLQDVTERELSALSLTRNNSQLAELNERKSNFFAGISHEFRTPLTLSIGELTDTLNGDYGVLPETIQAALNNVKGNNARLLKLVGQLLELSRLSQGQAMYHPELVDLADVLSGVTANFESFGIRQKTSIVIDGCARPVPLWFDVEALEKVLVNLLSNAFKSIDQNGTVHLTLSHSDDDITLSVKDTGHGIGANVMPHIFDAFYYHERPNARWPNGTGVGLHLVKQMLDVHGARINVNSTLDVGTEFIVTFAAGKAHLHQLLNHHKSPETSFKDDRQVELSAQEHEELLTDIHVTSLNEPGTGNVTEGHEKLVLIVEDNVQMRRYIRRHLGREFRLIEAEDGEEGYALAQESVPDLILSDLMMPKLNGLEFSQKIRETNSTSHIPIILLTAKSDSKDKLQGFKYGIDDYITKPFDAVELVVRIHNLIASREQLKQYFSPVSKSILINDSNTKKRLNKEALFLERFDLYVSEHLEFSDLRISAIADHFHMSERSLHRKLSAVVGASPKQYLLSLRMQEAQKRLTSTSDAVNLIAASTGFTDAAHFSRAFKSQHQITPLEFRKQSVRK